MFYAFRVKVLGKTISEWAKKFPLELQEKKIKHKEEKRVILFSDEKFISVKKVRAYW